MWVQERLFINICVDYAFRLRLRDQRDEGPLVDILFASVKTGFRLQERHDRGHLG